MAANARHAGAVDQPAPKPVATTRQWRTEDWMAVVLGFLVIAAVLAAFNWKIFDLREVVSTFRWTTGGQLEARAPGWKASLDAIALEAEAKGQKDVASLSRALNEALEKKDRRAIETAAGKLAKLDSKSLSGALGAEIRAHATAVAGDRVFTWANLSKVLYVGIAYLLLSAIGMALLGAQVVPFMLA